MKCGQPTRNGGKCKRTSNGGKCHWHKRNGFSGEQIGQVKKLAAVLNQTQLADFFEMSPDTFHRYAQDDERIMRAYKRGRTEAVAAVATSLLKAARDGDRSAQCFYLKCQAGWRETDRLEHTGADGGPIQTEDVTRIREELKTKLTLIQGGKAG